MTALDSIPEPSACTQEQPVAPAAYLERHNAQTPCYEKEDVNQAHADA